MFHEHSPEKERYSSLFWVLKFENLCFQENISLQNHETNEMNNIKKHARKFFQEELR